jgi:hypothetical protein
MGQLPTPAAAAGLIAAEPRSCTGPRPEVIDKFNVAAPRPVTTMFGGKNGLPDGG